MRARLAVIAPEIGNGLRAALATVVPFYLAGELQMPALQWVALGGWLGALADPGGARAARLKAVSAFLVFGSIALALMSVGSWSTASETIVLALIVFAASFSSALGATATSVGTVVAIVATISSGHPPSLSRVGMFAIGVAGAILTSAILWPVWRHRAVRVAVARVFERLGEYVDGIAAAKENEWPELARRHQRAVRAALEQARATVLAQRARHTGETAAGANLRALVGAAEDVFFRLIALAEQAERGEEVPRELAVAYHSIARDLYFRRAGQPVELAGDTSLVRETRAIAAIARDLDRGGEPISPPGVPARASRWTTLRDAFTVHGPILQHAVRVSLLAAVALVIGRVFTPEHPTWIPVSAIAVLQPYLGPTMKRAAERVVGTVLGAALTLALINVVRDPRLLAVLMVPLAVAAVMSRPRSYRLFVLFLTPVFVLLTDLSHPSWRIDVIRVIDVGIGGVLALVAAFIVPSRERRRLGPALDAVLDALASYVRLSTAGHARDAIVVARRAVGVTLEGAEASLERMLAEPSQLREGEERAMYLVTYARRFSASLTELLEGGEVVPTAIAGYLEIAIDRARTGGDLPPEPLERPSPAIVQLVQRAGLLARVPKPA